MSKVSYPFLVSAFVNSPTCAIGDRHEEPHDGESKFGDSSGPLFSLYSEIAEKEDEKKTDRWQKDADAILIFVSDLLAVLIALYITCST